MAKKKGINRIAAYNIASTILLNALSFLSSPIFSRILGTEQYGIVSVYTTWMSFFLLFVGMQTIGTMGTAWANFPEEKHNEYASSIMCLSSISFFAVLVLTFIFKQPLEAASELNITLILIMVVHSFGTFCVNFLNSKLTFDFSAGKNLALALSMSISTILLSFLFLYFAKDENLYVARILGMALPYCLMAICIPVAMLRTGRKLFSAEYWRFCIPLCAPLIFHGIGGAIQSQSDRIMLQKMTNDSTVGIYSLAYAFANVLETIRYAFNNTWVPFYYDYTGKGEIAEMLKRAKNYIFLFTGIVVGFILLTPEVFRIYAGVEFWSGVYFIPVLAFGSFLMLLYNFPVNYEFYMRKTKQIAVGSIMAAASNIALNIWLIPVLGAMGAAISTMASYALLFVFHHLIAKYIVGGEYPFKLSLFMPYIILVVLATVAFYAFYDLWLIRWALGAIMGVSLLAKIWKNKQLF